MGGIWGRTENLGRHPQVLRKIYIYIYVYTLSIWGYFGSIYYVPTGCMLNYPTPPAFLFVTPSLIWPLVAFGLGLDRNFWGTPAHKLLPEFNRSAVTEGIFWVFWPLGS